MSLLQKIAGLIIAISMTTLLVYVIASPSCEKFSVQPGNAMKDIIPSSFTLQAESEGISQNDILPKDNPALQVEYIQLADTENEAFTLNDSTLSLNENVVIYGSRDIISESTSSNNSSTHLPVPESSTSVSSSSSSGSIGSSESGSFSSSSGSAGGGSSSGVGSHSSRGGIGSTNLTNIEQNTDDLLTLGSNSGQKDVSIPPGLNFDYLNSSNFSLEKILPLLKPLPKPHYSFGISGVLHDSDELMYHLTRITSTTNIFGSDNVNYNRIAYQIRICNEVNMTDPDIESSIGIVYSPWHYALNKGYDLSMPPLPGSEEWNWSLGNFEAKMVAIKDAISQANDKYGCNIQVGNINFDTEIWRKQNVDGTYAGQEYIDRMTTCLDAFTDKSKEIFPNVQPTWFGRGKSFWGIGFTIITNPFWTGQEKTDHLSPYLYTVGNVTETDELFRQNCVLAREMECTEIIPYLALGCGYPREEGMYASWSFNWDYDLEASYQMGERLSRKSFEGDINNNPDYSMVEAVIFYPRPLDNRATYWSKHFAAYVMGATMTDVHE